MRYAPSVRFLDLPANQKLQAVLLVDGQRTLTWDVSGQIQLEAETPAQPATSQPQPQPQPQPEPPVAGTPGSSSTQTSPAPAGSAGFKPLRKFDVRVDRVASARDTQRIDVFLTMKNASAQPQYITSGTLQVILEDSEGVAKQNGQVLRPTDTGREHFGSTPVVAPGRELKVKYSFHPDTGTRPSRVTVMEGDKSADFSAGF
jgi:hypothetical protein